MTYRKKISAGFGIQIIGNSPDDEITVDEIRASSIDDIQSPNGGESLIDRQDPVQLAISYLTGLGDRKTLAFLLYKVGVFGEVYTQKRIAIVFGVSQVAVCKMIRDAERQIAESVAQDMGGLFL